MFSPRRYTCTQAIAFQRPCGSCAAVQLSHDPTLSVVGDDKRRNLVKPLLPRDSKWLGGACFLSSCCSFTGRRSCQSRKHCFGLGRGALDNSDNFKNKIMWPAVLAVMASKRSTRGCRDGIVTDTLTIDQSSSRPGFCEKLF